MESSIPYAVRLGRRQTSSIKVEVSTRPTTCSRCQLRYSRRMATKDGEADSMGILRRLGELGREVVQEPRHLKVPHGYTSGGDGAELKADVPEVGQLDIRVVPKALG